MAIQDAQLNAERRTGHYVTTAYGGETVRAYLPRPLPPEPPLKLDRLWGLLEAASRALGRLDGITSILPEPPLFIYMYVRKEALLSSQIEGTQSSLSDILLFEHDEAPGVPLDDVLEVSNYVAAMYHGLKRLKEGFPLSLRLIREIHAILLRSGRGASQQPGEFRRSQNWVGGTRPGNARFVPPPPDRLMECLDPFEKFLHERKDIPVLIRAALAHVQFETIHPFLDGNGRLGRLLITFLLCEEAVLSQPVLYLSLYLKNRRQDYYELLQRVREKGDWESWVDFFLQGVRDTAAQASGTAQRLISLFEADRAKVKKTGRLAASVLRVHGLLQKRPIISIIEAANELSLSPPAAAKYLQRLAELGIVKEITGKKRHRYYSYERYLKILNEGTEPLPR